MIKIHNTNIELSETIVDSLHCYKKQCDELLKMAKITNKSYIIPLLSIVNAPIFGTAELYCKPQAGVEGIFFLITHNDGIWKSADKLSDIYFKVMVSYSDKIDIETNSYLGMENLPESVKEKLVDCLTLVANTASKHYRDIENIIATQKGTILNMEFGV